MPATATILGLSWAINDGAASARVCTKVLLKWVQKENQAAIGFTRFAQKKAVKMKLNYINQPNQLTRFTAIIQVNLS